MEDESKKFFPLDQQKRQSARLRMQLKGSCRILERDQWIECTILDVSTGGLYLEGAHSFYKGDKLEVKFYLEKRPVFCQVSITNIQGRKAGGNFIKISDDDINYIRNLLHATYFDTQK